MKSSTHLLEPGRFVILNEFDRPYSELIAERRPDGLYYYVHPRLRGDNSFLGMDPGQPTPIEDFGVAWRIDGHKFHWTFDASLHKATYSDGQPRMWQEDARFGSFPYTEKMPGEQGWPPEENPRPRVYIPCPRCSGWGCTEPDCLCGVRIPILNEGEKRLLADFLEGPNNLRYPARLVGTQLLRYLLDALKVGNDLVEIWEEQFGEGACDCMPEPENFGHCCPQCRMREMVARFRTTPPEPEDIVSVPVE